MIAPGYLDLVIYQGATFQQTIDVDVDGSAYNMTGFTGHLVARKLMDTTDALNLTETTGLTLGNGTVTIDLTATETAAITAARYPYTLEVTTGGTVVRILEGIVRIVPEVTPA